MIGRATMIGEVSYPQFTGRKAKTYVFTREIVDLVNLAVFLGRPILVEGEAGCGKTTLARAIAEDLDLEKTFVSIPVKSTSQAKDLLYRFDGLRRLQDAQSADNQRAQQIYHYITLQPLGEILRLSKPCVVLIDEVDKADIDFPNDLLDVLDRFEFVVEDLPQEEEQFSLAREGGFGRIVKAQGPARPIVIITSNQEKRLPEPFLRRCLAPSLQARLSPAIC